MDKLSFAALSEIRQAREPILDIAHCVGAQLCILFSWLAHASNC